MRVFVLGSGVEKTACRFLLLRLISDCQAEHLVTTNTIPICTMQKALSRLEDFGTRSVVTHAIMAVAAAGAVLSALTVEGYVGDIIVVALMAFASGLWISQSVHSLGNSYTDDDYKGVLMYLMERL